VDELKSAVAEWVMTFNGGHLQSDDDDTNQYTASNAVVGSVSALALSSSKATTTTAMSYSVSNSAITSNSTVDRLLSTSATPCSLLEIYGPSLSGKSSLSLTIVVNTLVESLRSNPAAKPKTTHYLCTGGHTPAHLALRLQQILAPKLTTLVAALKDKSASDKSASTSVSVKKLKKLCNETVVFYSLECVWDVYRVTEGNGGTLKDSVVVLDCLNPLINPVLLKNDDDKKYAGVAVLSDLGLHLKQLAHVHNNNVVVNTCTLIDNITLPYGESWRTTPDVRVLLKNDDEGRQVVVDKSRVSCEGSKVGIVVGKEGVTGRDDDVVAAID
jgi:hypothetical protein